MSDEYTITSDWDENGYTISIPGGSDDVSVELRLELPENAEPSDAQRRVLEAYVENVRTYITKNIDYNSSYLNGPKIESLLKHGEVVDEELPHLLAKQIFVRGFLDKLSRFYNLYIDSEEPQVDESVEDTLLDMANYAVMLAAKLAEQSDEASTDD